MKKKLPKSWGVKKSLEVPEKKKVSLPVSLTVDDRKALRALREKLIGIKDLEEMLRLLDIPESVIETDDGTSGGSGGQNVNKRATKIETSIPLRALPSVLVKALRLKCRSRIGKKEGTFSAYSSKERSQDSNKKESRRILVTLIQKAIDIPAERNTKVPRGAEEKQRRVSREEQQKGKDKRDSRKNKGRFANEY